MTADTRIAAHLIVGPNAEPFLGALLESLSASADVLIVNDNSPDPSPHAASIAASAFGSTGRAIVDRAPFTGFANARNRCLELHAQHDAGNWVAFVDADEVHGPTFSTIASHLGRVPHDADFVDGYTWHFMQSFDYYTSIERRMTFFRFAPNARWEGAVHERLTGLNGKRIALPYVYAHYGHTQPARRHAEKGRLYSSLGQPGKIVAEEDLDSLDTASYFANLYPRLLRFSGSHPPAALATIARMRDELADLYALTDRMVKSQPATVKLRNVVRKLNYELRWRGRTLDPLARSLVAE